MTLQEALKVVALLDGRDVHIVHNSAVYDTFDNVPDDNSTDYRVVVL
jgi:hypothetical protein